MKAFDVYYPHLLPELPGCSAPLLDQHLLQLARDFCNRTSAWRDAYPAIDSQDSTLAYFLDTPETKSECVRVLTLTVNGKLLWSAVDPAADQDQPQSPASRPPFSINGDGDLITLEEQPTGAIEITGSMRPAMGATTLPDLLFNDYLEAMRTGTLTRLMVMRNQPWTDREAASYYAGEYAKHLSFAANKARDGNTRKPLRTRTWG